MLIEFSTCARLLACLFVLYCLFSHVHSHMHIGMHTCKHLEQVGPKQSLCTLTSVSALPHALTHAHTHT